MPSDTPEVLAKLKAMATPKRAQIGGHRVTVFLTDYDESNDSYFGEVHRNRSMEHGEVMPAVQSISGLRPYPYTPRPDYAFQFVECGEDEQPLIDIARGNVTDQAKALTGDPFGKPEEQSPGVTDPRDANHDGRVTKQEDRQYRKDHPGEER